MVAGTTGPATSQTHNTHEGTSIVSVHVAFHIYHDFIRKNRPIYVDVQVCLRKKKRGGGGRRSGVAWISARERGGGGVSWPFYTPVILP